MTSIKVQDVGAVVEFEYRMADYGLHILRGDHGVGKSTVLRTAQLAVDGRTDVKLTKRDGSKGGMAEIAGKTLQITSRQTRSTGDIEVEGVGDLDIAALHTPKFQEATTRDRHRIMTLTRLGGVKADAALFYPLFSKGAGDDGKAAFNAIIAPEVVMTEDFVEMAAGVKRALEREAGRREDQEQVALANMRAKKASIEGIDLAVDVDETSLQAAVSAAVEHRATVLNQAKNATQARERAEAARMQLESVGQSPTAMAEAQQALKEAEHEHAKAGSEWNSIRRQIEELQVKLAQADAAIKGAGARISAAKDKIASIEREGDLIKKWRADIDAAAKVAAPSDAEIVAANKAVEAANAAFAQGVKVRAALAANAAADEHAAEAKRHSDAAREYRAAARGTQEILSEAIGRIEGCPLKVALDDDGNARLVVATDRSPAEPFDDLSDGERWPHIIKIAAGRNRLIVLPQMAFGELSQETRRQLHELAVANQCYLLTAQVDSGALRGERFAESMQSAAAA